MDQQMQNNPPTLQDWSILQNQAPDVDLVAQTPQQPAPTAALTPQSPKRPVQPEDVQLPSLRQRGNAPDPAGLLAGLNVPPPPPARFLSAQQHQPAQQQQQQQQAQNQGGCFGSLFGSVRSGLRPARPHHQMQQQMQFAPPGMFNNNVGSFSSRSSDRSDGGLQQIANAMSELEAPYRHLLLAQLATCPELASLFHYEDVPLGDAPAATNKLTLPSDLQSILKDKLAVAKTEAEAAKAAAGALPAAAPAPAPAAGADADVSGLSLSLVPEFKAYGSGAVQDLRIVLSIKAPKEVKRQAQVSLTCVLDRSGSMSGARLQLVKETCHFLISQLTENDLLGFVSYSNDVRDDVPLVRMTEHAKAMAHHAIDSLVAEGGTALYDGLCAGAKAQLEAKLDPKIVKSVFLCTDGEANQGPSDADTILPGLTRLQEQYNESVMVHTFGFGQGHCSKLLQAIAEAASGIYYYIAASDDIPEGYGDALGGLLAVVAKSIKVSIKPLAGASITAVKSGGRVTVNNPTGNTAGAATSVNVAAGTAGAATVITFNDLFAAETREVLVHLALPECIPEGEGEDSATSMSQQVVKAVLEWLDPCTGLEHAAEEVLAITRESNVAAPAAPTATPEPLVLNTVARYSTVDALKEAAKLGEAGDVDKACQVLESHVAKLQSTSHPGVALPEVDMYMKQASHLATEMKEAARQRKSQCMNMANISSSAAGFTQQRQACAGTYSMTPAAAMWDNQGKAQTRASSKAYAMAKMGGNAGGKAWGSAPPANMP